MVQMPDRAKKTRNDLLQMYQSWIFVQIGNYTYFHYVSNP